MDTMKAWKTLSEQSARDAELKTVLRMKDPAILSRSLQQWLDKQPSADRLKFNGAVSVLRERLVKDD